MKAIHLRQMTALLLATALFLASGAVKPADGGDSLPKGMRLVALKAKPAALDLQHKFQYTQLLITGRLQSGQTVDVTRMAVLLEPVPVVSVSPAGLVRPAADGAGELTFALGDQVIVVPVKVSGIDRPHETSFVRDVMPAISKVGCNAGTCHGSKDGKNGFKLSLRGYDPQYDHRALTDDIGARRINRAAPEQSLMLLKASGSIPHVGGVQAAVDTPYYEIFRSWIARGMKLDLDAPRVSRIEIFPTNPIVPLPGMKQQMVVMATYTDGSVRDVSAETLIESGNIEVVETDRDGLITTLRRGEAAVLARYEGNYTATTITVMGDRSGFVWKDEPPSHYIDKLVYEKLNRVKIEPAELCSDAEFLRRVYLDLTGLPPMPEQVRGFLSDERDSHVKRDELVDRLVGGSEFVEHWTNKWADLLQVNRKFLGEEGATAFRNWIKHAIATNKPYDRFATEILTASGSNLENPPAGYYKTLRDPADVMENTTQLFLAVRFSCNKCHDHPFERWTQNQYYKMAAFFAQVGRKDDPAFAGRKIGGTAVEGAKPLVEVVYDTGAGEVTHLLTGQVSAPTFPYTHSDQAPETASRREQMAQWITSKENQYFAKSYVNRLWGYLFGVGIIEPIDDIRAGNPPTNPELLDALTDDFIDSGFDAQHMLRAICKSRTYQHSVATTKWNEDDDINYSHAVARRLPAEVLYDAIHRATGSTTHIAGVPEGFRAAELPDVGVKLPFLDDFGRPARESACECERSSGMVLGPIMKLVNGPTVADAIADPQNALTKLVAAEPDDAKIVQEMFVRFLARLPTDEETKLGIEAIRSAEPKPDDNKDAGKEGKDTDARLLGVQDLAWALINSPAFLFNR